MRRAKQPQGHTLSLAATFKEEKPVSNIPFLIHDIPAWVNVWLEKVGISLSAFLDAFNRLAEKYDAPDELKTAVATWIEQNVASKLNPDVILAFVTLVYTEYRSGAPGYNKGHLGGA